MEKSSLSRYSEVAQEALSLIQAPDAGSTVERASIFEPELLYALASQAGHERRPNLALALEYLDYQQHVCLNGREAAFVLRRLLSLSILEVAGESVRFTEHAWLAFPRTASGTFSGGKAARQRWQRLLR